MSETLILALQITAIGMGLVFAAIILLWWVMAALVRLTAEKEAAPEVATAAEPIAAPQTDDIQRARKQRAAAAAVAVALACETDSTQPHDFPLPPTAIVSAWQVVMRTRMLNKRGPTR